MEAETIRLADLKAAGRTVHESAEASLIDIGDGVACLEFHTKMNTFNPALVQFVDDARTRAEQDFAALVIGNHSAHFSVGYNLKLFLEGIEAQDWGSIEDMLLGIQTAFMGLKYARIPVVGAPRGYTLGGGCECALHCRALQATPDLHISLPESLVGVLPAGGGTTEMLARALSECKTGEDAFPYVERVFDLLLFPKNSADGEEARRLGFLRTDDGISEDADRQLQEAKERAMGLANAGYAPPAKQQIGVGGEDMLARLRMKIHWHGRSGVFSDHDRLIADRIAFVLSGGNLPYLQQVSEEYLLQCERAAFMVLAREPKTADRMRHMLSTGKPLKN